MNPERIRRTIQLLSPSLANGELPVTELAPATYANMGDPAALPVDTRQEIDGILYRTNGINWINLATGVVLTSSAPTNAVTQVGISTILANANNGTVIECTATITLTLPVGLMAGFSCVIIPSGTTSIASSGGTLLNGATTTLTRAALNNALFAIQSRGSAADSYVVTGV